MKADINSQAGALKSARKTAVQAVARAAQSGIQALEIKKQELQLTVNSRLDQRLAGLEELQHLHVLDAEQASQDRKTQAEGIQQLVIDHLANEVARLESEHQSRTPDLGL